MPLGGSLFRGAALEVPDDSLQAWPAASIAAFNGHGFLVRKPQCVEHLEQGRLVQGHRVLCPSARTIGVVSLTITRWPLHVITHVDGDLDLHHQRGRHHPHPP